MREILIIKPSSLGDIVHGLLIAAAIRQQLPGARISWVARDIFAPLVRQSVDVHKVYVFHRHRGWRGFLKLLGEIRQMQFDAVLDMQGLARSALLMLGSRATLKLARADAREGAGWLCRKHIPGPSTTDGAKPHAVDILRGFLPALGLDDTLPLSLGFQCPELSRELPQASPLVIFPGSRRAEKEWRGFSALTCELAANYPDIPLLWLGNETMASPFDTHNCPANFLNLTGLTPLGELPAHIAHARLVIANDSGPMHLAAALSVKVLALFGPTNPSQYGPYPLDNPANHVLRAPSGQLDQLSVETVLQTVKILLTTPY